MDIRSEYERLAHKLFKENLESPSTKKEILIDLVDLYVKSVDTFDHDIVNGIDLCIFEEGTPEILEYLREKKRAFNHDKYVVESIDSWIKKIQS